MHTASGALHPRCSDPLGSSEVAESDPPPATLRLSEAFSRGLYFILLSREPHPEDGEVS